MAKLRYKEDFDDARDRLTAWWNGKDIGRPAMIIEIPCEKPVEHIAEMPRPKDWLTDYSTANFEYRLNLALRKCAGTCYLAEAIPNVSPDLAPNCLALYLGCRGVEMPGTVWCEPCIETPENASFVLNPDNFYWRFTLKLAEEQLRLGAGKFLTSFPDLIEGLDTLAAMRDTENLLMDLLERPDWVHDSLSQITERYFDVYDNLYELIKDDRGGSHFWTWAPGRISKLQCDFSAMISPDMFGEFMVPVLTKMTERLDYCLYHWDGPRALCHHNHLLSIPRLTMIQWTPGAGAKPVMDRQWWPYYHKTVDAGKKVILFEFSGRENLIAFKKEFGPKLKKFMLSIQTNTLREAQELLDIVSE